MKLHILAVHMNIQTPTFFILVVSKSNVSKTMRMEYTVLVKQIVKHFLLVISLVLPVLVLEGNIEQKLLCVGCNARLGSFNWAGMQCSCGTWVNPAFQLHKNRIDECPL
ncbi:hypothetical protein MKW94_012203 [Papaver nudicaule]|uniref:Uncharacterized protein n=1 Tax=Papaver nudicaule TaxID=74823 RepID=A0AA41RW58_PAPNU|nr:hypothetical protein [Papaver nudicaule]